MDITFISDTHGLHGSLSLNAGDVLVHCGDFTANGWEDEARDYIDWMACQPFDYKIAIAGNHDFCLEHDGRKDLEHYMIRRNIIYLNDSGIAISGLRFWGSPITPTFYDWAFQRERGDDIRKHWAIIPDSTDIVITHGPPKGILDQVKVIDENVGCDNLRDQMRKIKPLVHAFGHIHEGFGQEEIDGTTFVNASVLHDSMCLVNPPTTVNVSLARETNASPR